MEKLDLRQQYKHLYKPRHNKVTVVEVPIFKFALIDGAIERGKTPGTSPSFMAATEMMYAISYTLKFMSKQREEDPIDYAVMALEALWWIEDGKFDISNPSNWLWTTMIMQPDHITNEMFQAGLVQVRKKKHLFFQEYFSSLLGPDLHRVLLHEIGRVVLPNRLCLEQYYHKL